VEALEGLAREKGVPLSQHVERAAPRENVESISGADFRAWVRARLVELFRGVDDVSGH